MKILHVTQEMFKTSGVATFCREIAAEQMRAGHEVLALVQGNYDLKFDEDVKVVVGPSMEMAGERPDIVHIHGLWAPFSARAMTWCRQHGIPYVVSTHGCLMPRVFKKGWLKKHLFWCLALRKGVEQASLIHCTAEAERKAVARFGFEVPYVIAPLGVRIRTQVASRHANLAKSDVATTPTSSATPQSPFCQGPSRTALFLGRISDEKGLPLLLDAWKRLDAADWRLVIAGPDWRGYRALLEKKVAEEGIRGVEFHDPVFGPDKDALYRNADLFALASPVENFSAVVLDALAFGVPVICTKGTPWGCIEREKCGWWVEPNSSAALYEALKVAVALPRNELQETGQRGVAIAKRDYNWETISETILKGYESVL